MLYIHDIWAWGLANKTNLGEIKYSTITSQPILDYGATLLSKLIGDPLMSYNLLITLSFVLSGFFTYAVAYKITKNRLASLVSGFIFSFSPYHIRQAQNHLEIAQIEVIPFYFLFFYEYLKNKNLKNSLITGIALAVSTLTVNYYGLFLGILTAVFFATDVVIRRTKRLKKDISSLVILLTAGLFLVGICDINFIKIYATNKNLDEYTWKAIGKTEQDYIKYAAKPWFYVLPDIANPPFGNLSKQTLIKISNLNPYYLTRTFSANENSLYLGLIPILLSTLAFKHKPKTAKVLALIALVFIILSFPPYIFFKSREIYLPNFIFMKIFPMFRVYSRAGVITLFMTSLLSGIGLSYLLAKFNRKILGFLITISTLTFILIEFYMPAQTTKLLPLPPEYQKAISSNVTTVLEAPKLEDHSNVFYQVYHNKPVYFIRTDSKQNMDITDPFLDLNRYDKPVELVFRGNFEQIYYDHKTNELGLDLEDPYKTSKSEEGLKNHIIWFEENNKNLEKASGTQKTFFYDETSVFLINKYQ